MGDAASPASRRSGRAEARRLPGRMNPTDAALWDIERDPSLRTTIVALLVLEAPIPFEQVRDRAERATRLVPRLRHVVREARGGVGVPSWVPDPAFDLDYHVRHQRVPPPADRAAVLRLAAPLAAGAFDRSRPLWELVYVDGLEDGTAVLVLRVHHSLTDGVGGVDLLDALLDPSPDAPPPEPAAAAPSPEAPGLAGAARGVARTAGAIGGRAAGTARDPLGTARRAAALVPSTARVLGPSLRPRSPLMTGRGLGRRLLTLDVPLDELAAAGRAAGGTVNDAFVAAVLDGVSRYHLRMGSAAEELRFTMPVNLRRPGDDAGGNQWAPARFVLPAGPGDPVTRMRHIHDVVASWRREPALAVNQTLAGFVQQLPGPLSATVVGQMMRGVDVIVSNVPGPSGPRWLAGVRVTALYAMAPTAGSALNVTLVSGGATACIGVAVDTAAVGDLEALEESLHEGFAEVLTMAARAPAPPPAEVAAIPPIERLSFLDAGFLRAEGRTTPMNLGAVLVLDGAPLTDGDGRLRLDEIRAHVAARIALAPRYRRRLVDLPVGGAWWVDGPAPDMAHHVREAGVPAPGGTAEVMAVAAELHATPLDRNRPLWELWFLTGLDGGEVALVEKVHHAMVDGVAGVELLTALLDTEPAPAPVTPPPAPAHLPTTADVVRHALGAQVRAPVGAGRAVAGALRHPDRLARQLAAVAGTLGDAATHPSGAPALHRPVGTRRRLLPVDLARADLERLRTADGGGKRPTLNDVVLTVVAGGLRALALATGEPTRDVRAAVPISHRQHSDRAGNQLSIVLLPLPVAEADPRRRLRMVTGAVARLRAAHRDEGAELLFDIVDHLPAPTGAVVPLVHHQPFADVVVTNVPGPPELRWFCGAEVRRAVPIVPLLGNTDLGVAVLSYRDRVCVALHADPDRCPQLDAVADGIRADLAALGPPRRSRER